MCISYSASDSSFLFFIESIQGLLDDLFKLPGAVKKDYEAKLKANKELEALEKTCPVCLLRITLGPLLQDKRSKTCYRLSD
jgi:hypothetical protein